MQNTRNVTLLDALQCKSGNQRSTDTATVLGGQNLDRVLVSGVLLLGPVKDLAERQGTALLEVGVLVEDGAVGTNVASLVVLLLADSSNTAG